MTWCAKMRDLLASQSVWNVHKVLFQVRVHIVLNHSLEHQTCSTVYFFVLPLDSSSHLSFLVSMPNTRTYYRRVPGNDDQDSKDFFLSGQCITFKTLGNGTVISIPLASKYNQFQIDRPKNFHVDPIQSFPIA